MYIYGPVRKMLREHDGHAARTGTPFLVPERSTRFVPKYLSFLLYKK
jgi:hypothetical protein